MAKKKKKKSLGIIKAFQAIKNDQLKCSDFSVYFQCVWMAMNNISVSGGLTQKPFYIATSNLVR